LIDAPVNLISTLTLPAGVGEGEGVGEVVGEGEGEAVGEGVGVARSSAKELGARTKTNVRSDAQATSARRVYEVRRAWRVVMSINPFRSLFVCADDPSG
jgi:acyl-CoA reductase-like NAD-dependent aldehyde dehydrogenase